MNEDVRKVDADKLLRSIEKEEDRKKRGLLRIFLGMCPGVGKTFSMLQAAQERKKSGADVVVGLVETHGRQETKSILEGLEILPRKAIEYRGKTFEELDVDAILSRKPELVLVDELAHSNIPGARHPKRYHDVKELLDAGLDVYTTMNVQHLESRIDLVRQITGITVHESVPDSFFELADQVELIDLPPTELLKRLKSGKVYLGDMAERAIEGFFQEEHLLALRELALRFTAEVVEGELHDQMLRKQITGPWHTRERLMVAISHSPYSKRLIRAARRKAFNLEANWVALYVDTGETLNEEEKGMLRKNLDMARELGAELVSIREGNVPLAIRRIAEEKNVTQIIMGRPDRRFFRDLLSGGTILDKLVRETSEIDIHVLRQVRKPRLRSFKLRGLFPEPLQDLSAYTNTFWVMAVVGTISFILEPIIRYEAVGFLFLLAVIGISVFVRRGPTLFAALLSALGWNYFFIPPKYTFYIKEVADVMMNVAYFAVAVTASFLTSKIRKQGEELRRRAQQTSLLYDFSRELGSSRDLNSIASVTGRFVEHTIGGLCRILTRDKDGEMKEWGFFESVFQPNEKHLAVAYWVIQNGKRGGVGTETLSGSEVLCLPIQGSGSVLGVMMYFPKGKKTISVEEETTLQSVCASAAISIERENLQKQTETIRIVEESEKLYQTILDSVSHELRTPITSIMGAATALQDAKTVENESNRKPLTDEIIRGTKRLNHVVENLLDTSRMTTGKLNLKKDLVDLSETVESIVNEWKSRESVPGAVRVEAEETYALVDSSMLRNAIENLLHNALKHSSSGGEIRVRVKGSKQRKVAVIEVLDEGKGIPHEDREKIFHRFYRVPGTPAGGIGLGLSIVRGIVEAHGGKVEALNRTDKRGSLFRIEIPLWSEEIPKV
jgi:two-component system, OmpR family, sensor histidine kinase KdpD